MEKETSEIIEDFYKLKNDPEQNIDHYKFSEYLENLVKEKQISEEKKEFYLKDCADYFYKKASEYFEEFKKKCKEKLTKDEFTAFLKSEGVDSYTALVYAVCSEDELEGAVELNSAIDGVIEYAEENIKPLLEEMNRNASLSDDDKALVSSWLAKYKTKLTYITKEKEGFIKTDNSETIKEKIDKVGVLASELEDRVRELKIIKKLIGEGESLKEIQDLVNRGIELEEVQDVVDLGLPLKMIIKLIDDGELAKGEGFKDSIGSLAKEENCRLNNRFSDVIYKQKSNEVDYDVDAIVEEYNKTPDLERSDFTGFVIDLLDFEESSKELPEFLKKVRNECKDGKELVPLLDLYRAEDQAKSANYRGGM